MNDIPIFILNYVFEFLQRTDQISWKITSKYYLSNLIHNNMNLNEELNLYIKNIDNLDYAWKGDTRYINIHELHNKSVYDLLNKYLVVNDLWYFDFNADFEVFSGNYIIFFLTSVSNYKINIKHIDIHDEITLTSHEPIKNKIKINFISKGKITVNCREINNYKHNQTVQYIMCIPEYYWNKIYNYKYNSISTWKQQIFCTKDSNFKLLRKF
jgi:hypothetical protein